MVKIITPTSVPLDWAWYKKDISNLVYAFKFTTGEPVLEVHTPKISNLFNSDPLHTLYLPQNSRYEDLISYVFEYRRWYKKRIFNAYDFLEPEIFEYTITRILSVFETIFGDKDFKDEEDEIKHQIIWIERHLFKISSKFKGYSPLVRKKTMWNT